jgi:hypothetical protein
MDAPAEEADRLRLPVHDFVPVELHLDSVLRERARSHDGTSLREFVADARRTSTPPAASSGFQCQVAFPAFEQINEIDKRSF